MIIFFFFFLLLVHVAEPRLTGPLTKEVKVKEGDNVTLKCEITVNPSKITWMVDDRVLNGRNCATRLG